MFGKYNNQNSYDCVKKQRQNITLEQLARFDGKNGNPAYVAVDGIVYDVTNNAGWAAATHFGLKAGTDVSGPFKSCHGSKQILSRLKIVGSLIS